MHRIAKKITLGAAFAVAIAGMTACSVSHSTDSVGLVRANSAATTSVTNEKVDSSTNTSASDVAKAKAEATVDVDKLVADAQKQASTALTSALGALADASADVQQARGTNADARTALDKADKQVTTSFGVARSLVRKAFDKARAQAKGNTDALNTLNDAEASAFQTLDKAEAQAHKALADAKSPPKAKPSAQTPKPGKKATPKQPSCVLPPDITVPLTDITDLDDLEKLMPSMEDCNFFSGVDKSGKHSLPVPPASGCKTFENGNVTIQVCIDKDGNLTSSLAPR